MIKTLIIDDEPLATELVLEYLTHFPDFKVLKICHDGFEGIKAIQEHDPDLIFLDVQMPKITGFEMLELLENPPAVIFTTAYDEFAIKAFDAHAVDYLLKPFSKERFEKAISKFRQMGNKIEPQQDSYGGNLIQSQSQRIVLKIKNEIKIIPFHEVKFFEANDDYINIYTDEGKFLKNKTLISLERILDPVLFVRVHRSYIVKIGEITKVEPYEKNSYILKLRSGATIPVSKTGFSRLKAILGI